MWLLYAIFLFFTTTINPAKLYELHETDVRCGYQSCPVIDPEKLNVHLIAHSYNSLGWTSTAETLFYKNVQYIISSVVDALQVDPNRKFIQVETAYFHKWWELQNDYVKNSVKQLIDEGRLVITNGGWSMNDEATSHYQSIIDQFTLGHRWLLENFGTCGIPNAGWQIETHGHSREQASIYSQMGFDSFFITHLDYRDRNKRKTDKTLDLLWKGSANLGKDSNIFTTIFSSSDYSWPHGFCYDMQCDSTDVVDDESSPEFNQKQIVDNFTRAIEDYAQYYSTNNVFITMGGSMHYQGAHKNFINIDRIISGFKKYNPGINIFYSTPSCYAKAVHDHVIKENYTLNYKTDDFLPVVTESEESWTGFYASRPTSKRYERISNHMLQAAKQITALAGFPQNTTFNLASALGLMQHHEIITGTEIQSVERDQHRMLYAGIADSVNQISEALSYLLKLSYNIGLKYCPFANISICKESRTEQFQLILYNPLGRNVTQYVQVPVDNGIWTVTDPEDMIISSQLFSPGRDFTYVTEFIEGQVNEKILMFKAADLPPLGYKVYNIVRSDGNDYTDINYDPGVKSDRKIGYENNYVIINEESGFIEAMSINGFEQKVTPEIMFYYSAYGSTSRIFKVNNSVEEPVAFTDKIQYNVTKYDEVSIEITQTIRFWVIFIIRIYPDTEYIEIEYIIGPTLIGNDDGDLKDAIGKDFIIRYTTDLNTNDIFYTDSNGRELLERRRNYRPTFTYTDVEHQAANYYPVTNRIVIKDKNKGVEFAVITDRTHGGSSLVNGQIELMISRILLVDEEFTDVNFYEMEYDAGVFSRGSHYITFGPTYKSGGRSHSYIQRDMALRRQLPTLMFFTSKFIEKKTMFFLNKKLPDNVHLLTFEKWNDSENTYLIRLEHFLEKDDDPDLSNEVTVDLKNLFTVLKITSLEERTLNGALVLKDKTQFIWPQIDEDDSSILSRANRSARDSTDLEITLAPMQIRTFIATVQTTNK